ncbi:MULTISPECIES: HesB/YadR/YfhF family protein [Limosilactobacillus]|jgi:uncharacterized protein YneR|uniref:HesB/YadR/YfhF family protein n=1 Tax=Limosilactobacillus TaxID=2742598 RepID=UPI001C3B2137|nr:MULTISPECIES: heme biosynthesis protein HemY [Limosilactobacillus]MDM8332351.1 heme biosynthesis protein HemY [Limosilactobacillus pontis]HJA74314.1 heme biosynthesis protein HemY [Candidatus Limosilactobacillus gallistercoris]
MKLIVTDAANEWFKNEMDLKPGDGIKFYGKVYGRTEVHHGFSQAFAKDNHPIDPVLEVVKDGINYHVNEVDEWFFTRLITTVDANADGPVFHFQHEDQNEAPDVAGMKSDQDDHSDNQADASTGASQHFEH